MQPSYDYYSIDNIIKQLTSVEKDMNPTQQLEFATDCSLWLLNAAFRLAKIYKENIENGGN